MLVPCNPILLYFVPVHRLRPPVLLIPQQLLSPLVLYLGCLNGTHVTPHSVGVQYLLSLAADVFRPDLLQEVVVGDILRNYLL